MLKKITDNVKQNSFKTKAIKALGVLSVTAVALTLLTSVPTLNEEAHAGFSAGSGGAGGGGAGVQGFYWTKMSLADFNNPWNGYAAYAGMGAAGGLNPSECTTGHSNIYGKKNGLGQSAWSQAPVYERSRAGALSWQVANAMNQQYVNIICENEPPEVRSPLYVNYRVASAVQPKTEVKREATHTYTITVAPQHVRNDKNALATTDIIGVNNLNTQTDSQITEFGKLYEQIEKEKAAIGNNKNENMVAKWKDRVNSVTDNQRTQIDLNAKNKAGLAEGGILNVTEGQKRATITISTTPTRFNVQDRTFYRWTKNGAHVRWEGVRGWQNLATAPGPLAVWSTEYSLVNNPAEKAKYKGVNNSGTWTTYANSAVTKLNTTPTTGFWQMLSVHCNQDAFNALVAELGNQVTVETTGGEANGTAGLAHTVKYASAADARAKNGGALPFGDVNATTPQRKATANLGFYDKECSFECTASPTAKGASSKNDATNNIEYTDERNEYGDRNGATHNENAGNIFEFFRDNGDRDVRLNVRYPVSAGNINYDGHAAKTTTVTNWSQGTPGTIPVTGNADKTKNSGGIFSVVGKDGKNIFGEGKVKNQRNWDSGTFKSPNSAVVNYQLNTLNTKASWASEVGKPQILNVKWEFAPNISTANIPTGKIGFNNSGAKTIGSKTTEITPIEGKCYAQFGATGDPSYDTKQMFIDNTGTGTTNNIDKEIIGTGGDKNTAKDHDLNLVFNFVRSTTE